MFELFKLIGLGLVLLLPLVNPLTTVALFLGLSGDMSEQEKKKQSAMAAFYVFVIMMVAWYAGKAVINTFGISIPGLRIAGGMIVAFIGFNMLFPQDVNKPQNGEKGKTKNIAFIPLAMPSTAGPGTIAMLISAASTFSAETSHLDLWVAYTAPPPDCDSHFSDFMGISAGVTGCYEACRNIWNRCYFPSDGIPAGLYGGSVCYKWRR